MKYLVQTQRFVIALSSILILIGLTTAVLLRYLLKMDLYAIEELIMIPVILLYFIGGANGSYEDNHISADILQSYLKKETHKLVIRVITMLITLVSSAIIIYWNSQYLLWSISHGGKTTGYGIPLFIPHSVILVGFILMFFYTLLHLISTIKQLKTGSHEEGSVSKQ